MGTTTPDGIGYADVGYTGGLRLAVKNLADTVQTALTARGSRTFRPGNAAALAALASSYTLQTDDRAYQVDTGITYRYNGTTWKVWDVVKTNWTPTYTNLTIGSGGVTDYSFYIVAAGLMTMFWKVTLGSSPTVGNFTITTPQTMIDIGGTTSMGHAQIFGASTRYPGAVVQGGSTTTLAVKVYNASATYGTLVDTSSTIPLTFASGHTITLQGTVPVA